MSSRTATLPETSLYRRMAEGHQVRTGHAMVAHLESEDGETWAIVRDCCD